jgi:large subunit ribosomal protein L15
MLMLNALPKTHGRRKKRVGRGNASRGTYSGKGMKGQRARSGGRGGLKLRGLKQSMMAQPKARGFTSPNPRAQVVNLQQLDKAFAAGDTVDVAALAKRGLVVGTTTPVKLLATGKLSKALTVKLQGASKTAQEAVTKAGGSYERVHLPARSKQAKPAKAAGKTAKA